jgi:hypothetical protein
VRSYIVIQLQRRLQNWQPISLVACNPMTITLSLCTGAAVSNAWEIGD